MILDQNIRNEILFIDDDIESFNYWDNCKQIKLDGEKNSFIWNMRHDNAEGFDGLLY